MNQPMAKAQAKTLVQELPPRRRRRQQQPPQQRRRRQQVELEVRTQQNQLEVRPQTQQEEQELELEVRPRQSAAACTRQVCVPWVCWRARSARAILALLAAPMTSYAARLCA